MDNNDLIIYKNSDGNIIVDAIFKDETLWLTQKGMSKVFDVQVPDISKRLNDIYNDVELDKNSTISKMEIVQQEGNRKVKRLVDIYNLDAIIAVGYRVNSDRAVQFRRWATRIDKYLLSDDRDILKDAGKISHEIACDKALTEFEKYRVKQDKLYKLDFVLLMEESEDYNN